MHYTAPMTGQLHQMNLEYSASQDRLVLKINTTDKQEARLYLTRRFTRELWDALIKILADQPEIKKQANPEVKKAMMAFEQDAKTTHRHDFRRHFFNHDR